MDSTSQILIIISLVAIILSHIYCTKSFKTKVSFAKEKHKQNNCWVFLFFFLLCFWVIFLCPLKTWETDCCVIHMRFVWLSVYIFRASYWACAYLKLLCMCKWLKSKDHCMPILAVVLVLAIAVALVVFVVGCLPRFALWFCLYNL